MSGGLGAISRPCAAWSGFAGQHWENLMFFRSPVVGRGDSARRLSVEVLERRELLSAVPPTVVDVEVASSQWSSAFVEFLQSQSLGQQGYSIPVGTPLQSCSLTWTGIDQIIIQFSEDVRVDAEDLSLSGINTTAYEFSDFRYDFDYDLDIYVATWTLTAPVFIDRLQIDLNGDGLDPVRNLANVALDGTWVNGSSQYQSGGTTAGVDFQFTFNVLPADIDNSGSVGHFDYRFIYQSRGSDTEDSRYVVFRDIDGDGYIDSVDWQVPVSLSGQTLPSGLPAGVSNDAPTTKGLNAAEIPVGAQDVALSLLYGFDDAEDGAGGLEYSIVDFENEALLGGSYIDTNSNELVLNAAAGINGRTSLTIRATDSGGLFVDTVIMIDVGLQNAVPAIQAYAGLLAGFDWYIVGQLVDFDDAAENFIMELTGAVTQRFLVQEDGQFECVITVPSTTTDYTVYLTTWDPQGAQSNTVMMELFLA
jgi:hypothetical protein